MKKIFLIIIIFLGNLAKAQQTYSITYNGNADIYQKNNKIKDDVGTLDKFDGDWKWTSPTNPDTYMIIRLFKILDWNPNPSHNYFEDKVLGNYRYIENGIEITNTLNFTELSNVYATNFVSMLANLDNVVPFDNVSINMVDIIKSKNCKAEFKIVDVNATVKTATWQMRNTEGIKFKMAVISGFTLPNNIILTKQ